MTKKNYKKEISKILVKWNMPTRQVAINEIVSLFKTTLKGFEESWQSGFRQAREDILPELYQIWASIPLTQGKIARKQIKKLIDRLEKK